MSERSLVLEVLKSWICLEEWELDVVLNINVCVLGGEGVC